MRIKKLRWKTRQKKKKSQNEMSHEDTKWEIKSQDEMRRKEIREKQETKATRWDKETMRN